MGKKPLNAEPRGKITPEMLGVLSGTGLMGTEGMFDGQMDDPQKHIKELLTTDGDVDGKTDLTQKQIRSIIKIKQLALALGDEVTDNKGNVTDIIPDPTIMAIPEEFKRLRISKDRKSRQEVVDTIKGSNPYNRQEGMFNKIGGWFNR